MLKKEIKLNLLKNLFNTQFLYLENYKIKKKSNKRFNNVKVKSMYLDFFKTLVLLKQFIRCLQHLKRIKPSIKNLQIVSLKEEHLDLFSYFLKTKSYINISKRLLLNERKKINNLLVLDDKLFSNSNYLKNAFLNKYYTILIINNFLKINNSGIYQIKNDLTDIKKLIFLIVLLNKIYNINLSKNQE